MEARVAGHLPTGQGRAAHTRREETHSQAYRNEVCIRTRAVFNGETITSEAKLSVEAEEHREQFDSARTEARPRCGRA